ncbi:MAG: DsrE family protein [Candidatus Desulfatibia sp.]|uniref:DsrE family protein n=1 Tax=Candidatus Desulfatibia sp. TaxID=3101189 RepID=UPI002F332D3F
MASNKIMVQFLNRPFGTIHYVEGLRASLGIASGWDEHEVYLLFMGEGVYYALKGVNRTDSLKYIHTLEKLGFGLNVERESLQELGIDESDISEEFNIVSRAEVFELMKEQDFTVDF